MALLVLAGPGQADTITVVNPSFEDPVLADDGFTGSVSGWTYTGSARNHVIWNPTSTMFDGAAGNGTPIGADGSNILQILGANGTSGTFSQTLSSTLQAGKTYTLTVALGLRSDWPVNRQFTTTIEICTADMTSGQYLARYDALPADLTSAQFVDRTVSFAAEAGNSHLGQNLVIRLGMNNVGQSTYGASCFDNVRLTDSKSSATPGTLIYVQ